MSSCLSVLGSLISQLCSFSLPWGISFGAIVVGFATMPILVQVIKKIF